MTMPGAKAALASALIPITLMVLGFGFAAYEHARRQPSQGTPEATRPPPPAGSAGRGPRWVRVRFLNGTKREQELVRSVVWQHINTLRIPIRFVFVSPDSRGPSTVRIRFSRSGRCWSHVGLGKDSFGTRPTMSLDLQGDLDPAETQRSILHEFGHALGLLHQHQHPDCDIRWNVARLKSRYGCDNDIIQSDWCDRVPCPVSLPYDPDSVMHYDVEVGDAYNVAHPFRAATRFSPGDELRLRLMYSKWPGRCFYPWLRL